MRARPRLIIGIDLGTTNCALAWADLDEVTASGVPHVRHFAVPQLVVESEFATRPTLPSFLYVARDDERDGGHLALPWDERPSRVAGLWARDHGALLPGRLVSSAKSWLCHGGVDRRANILPWDADPAERVCSPLDASTAYLVHLREAWNLRMASRAPERRLERQHVVLTVPASFDEEARELTIEAARAAGIEKLTLQEEPTAALYAWLGAHQAELKTHLRPGDTVLVCDVGGGTTDFTLVTVGEVGGELSFERKAVGDHLLLGGDNLDLALARLVESRLSGPPLTLRQLHALRRQSAAAKERLLSPGAPDRIVLNVLGAGRSVVGAARTAELAVADVERALLDGFLPVVDGDERPRRDNRLGLRELGLPFESDPAITRHLAAFLSDPGTGHGFVRPDAVLLNGGFFAPSLARERVIDVVRRWFARDEAPWVPRVLTNASPATAVAEGAAGYGLVEHGFGIRIGGGSPRAYYIGLHSGTVDAGGAVETVCVLPRGTEAGTALAVVDRQFEVVANLPRVFSLWSSRSGHEELGQVVQLDPTVVHAHAPLVTELRFGKRSRSAAVPVRLEVTYTELGTLELWLSAVGTDHRWRLQFELRRRAAAAHGDETAEAQAVVDEATLRLARDLVARAFDPAAPVDAAALDQLPPKLEGTLGLGRHSWPLAAIRPLSDSLIAVADGRRATGRHEARWLNLFGFCLRPGFGATLDDWRMAQARRVYLAGLCFPADVQCQAEWLVLWQRVAGGLTTGQQQDLYQRHAPVLLASMAKRGKRLAPQVEREAWRMLASLERLPPQTRVMLGDHVLARLNGQRSAPALWWAIGRIGARVPTYGPINTVTPPGQAAGWVEQLLSMGPETPEALAAVADMAALTGDAARDLDATLRHRVAETLGRANAPEAVRQRVVEVRDASRTELQRRYGESLPEGLALKALLH